eukprot:c6501_g1_i1.p1 GENE.c6501_g1_i1~~c6501_g1_i1.p1  ORF type:complete len:445 (-),score=97.22 c6501_g1_i1:8-1342(-)
MGRELEEHSAINMTSMEGVRLARKQTPQTKNKEQGHDYNIWYHKHAGNRYQEEREKAETRVSIQRDAGWTRGEQSGAHKFCVHFARGCCTKGPDCTYLHRIPTALDDAMLPIAEDVFGRERFSTDRDDMGGVGNFMRDNRTLYVGGLSYMSKNTTKMEDTLRDQFGEFGDIVHIRVIPSKSCGFVTFSLRASAEFAKEAMTNQTLGDDAILNVRWAMEDPNPRVKEEIERKKIETLAKVQVLHGHLTADMVGNLPNADVQTIAKSNLHVPHINPDVDPLDFDPEQPSAKKPRVLTVQQRFAQAQLALRNGVYPDTADQYQSTDPNTQTAQTAQDEQKQQQPQPQPQPQITPAVADPYASASDDVSSYAQQWYEWANQFFAHYGRWPSQQDWEYHSTLSYYGGVAQVEDQQQEEDQSVAGPELPPELRQSDDTDSNSNKQQPPPQ